MIKLIAFDADDTLWHNENHYTSAIAHFKQILSKYHNPELVGKRLDEIEINNIASYGYGIKSFVLSMIETAADISAGQISGTEVEDILAMGKQMLKADVHLVENVENTLSRLAKDFPLMMITKGDLFEQEKKVERSGLKKYFRYIEIVGEKTMGTYQVLLENYGVKPEQFLMVGNSLKSDILPVLEIGGQVVYVPCDNTWAHEIEVGESLDNHTYNEIEKLEQLPELIKKLVTSQ